jgi:hypothetical protein
MRTNGYGNDSWMVFLTIAISIAVGTILFGGPVDAIDAANALVDDLIRGALQAVSAWL